MQQMFNTKKKDESTVHQSELYPFPITMGRYPVAPGQRDSGYGTDYSPASASSSSRQFTFSESWDIFEEMDDLNLAEEVFPESGETNKVTMNKTVDDDDDTDKEIEELLSDNAEVTRTVSQPISIQRPPAPIPTPEYYAILQPVHNACCNKKERHRNRFRPIPSRTFGTPTPGPRNQTISDARSVRAVRPNTHSSYCRRTRVQSESGDGESNSPLPDVIQFPRDRSVSLPDVPAYRRQQHEQEVGRELRRISDEFNSSFTRVQQGNSSQSSSFPLRVNIDFYACISGIRRILSSSPVFWTSSPPARQMNRDPNNDPSNFE